MCTCVQTPDLRILLDAGVSLCPRRFGFPPHPREFEAIMRSRKKIAEEAAKAEIVTISHYHNDHFTPSFEDWLCNWTDRDTTARQIYEDKTVLVKNSRENINYSQRERAYLFLRLAGKYASKLEVADGKAYKYGNTSVSFYEPVPHGPENSELGWVLMTSIVYENERFMFAPDVQGPIARGALKMIIEENPQMLLIGGPPLYLQGLKVGQTEISLGLENLVSIAERIPLIVLDHHILRDRDWRTKSRNVLSTAEDAGNIIQTSAEYLGQKNRLLEADRKALFDAEPPSKEFVSWMHLNEDAKRLTKPPLEVA